MTHGLATATQPTLDVAERRNGIGGSDIGAILGLSPWASALDVYLEKTGEREPFTGNEHTRWGQALEDVIARRYAEDTGFEVLPGGLFINPREPWQRGNTDRDVPFEKRGLECKTADWRQAHRWGEPGTDEIPEEYLAQCHWYLALPQFSTYDRWDVAVLLGGNDFRIYTVLRDVAFERALVDRARSFWFDNVLAKRPPPVDGSETAREWLARRYPREAGPMLQATNTLNDLAMELREARAQLDAAENRKALLENQLKELIADAAGVEGEGWRITWKATKGRPSVDWKAVAAECAIPADVIERHTRRTPVRVFRPKFAGQPECEE